jgi:DNA repair protein RecO (recombination protein O)
LLSVIFVTKDVKIEKKLALYFFFEKSLFHPQLICFKYLAKFVLMPDLLKSEAIVLETIRWKESSKIVTLFSREWGIIKVIARGVYRNKSTFAGKLESLNRIDTVINSKDSRSLQILTEADVIDSFNVVRMDLERLPYALAILELIRQTVHEQHSDTIFFDFIIEMLNALKSSTDPPVIFIYFLLKLVSFLGFKPNFDICQVCEKPLASGYSFFSLENGTIYCQDCAEGAAMLRKIKSEEVDLLKNLQKYPHRKIAEFEGNDLPVQQFISLLIDYLNFHTEANLTVRSLSMLI